MNWSDRLYFGTWQLGGQFKQMSSAYVESLLHFAVESGICRFDTAAVYGGGKVEEMLGACLPKNSVIVSKIPAITKPDLTSLAPIQSFYPRDHIHRSVDNSLCRLHRDSVDAVLLHNWLPSWSSDAISILRCLTEMKHQGVVKRIGISLPDDFAHTIDNEVLSYVDVIEVPFNSAQRWILEQLPVLQGLGKEILLRSLFSQGRLLNRYSLEDLLHEALALQTSVVIGMTTEDQITQNINHLKKGDQQ